MKIALVVPGGVDRSAEVRIVPALLALITRLTARHSVHVFALSQEPRSACWDLAGARVHNIGRGLTRARAVLAIGAEHRREPFQVIHSIWAAGAGLVAVCAGRWLRLPSVVHVAGGELCALPEIGYGGRLRALGRIQEALVLRGASALTAASAPMIEVIQRLGRPGRRIPLGVDLGAWPVREPLTRDLQAPARLIHIASLNRVKDQATLLRALALLAKRGVRFELDIVGEDTLGGAIQRLAAELQLSPRVRFHGFLPQRQLRALLQGSHLMVISSRHEAGPLAMLEAAVCGVPTIGTRVGHIAEWSPVAALAVPIGDAAALAVALEQLLGDESARLRLAREVQRHAALENADYTAHCFEALYGELAAPAP
jgi:glycosyltransferase involved in cell wall biosynthesis